MTQIGRLSRPIATHLIELTHPKYRNRIEQAAQLWVEIGLHFGHLGSLGQSDRSTIGRSRQNGPWRGETPESVLQPVAQNETHLLRLLAAANERGRQLARDPGTEMVA